MSKLTQALLQLLYPSDAACFLCNRPANVDERCICASCAQKLHNTQNISCPDGLDGLYAPYYYTEIIEKAVYRLKYYQVRYVAKHFAALLQFPDEWRSAVLVPVPLHKRRQRMRGYNQSTLIAKAMITRCPMDLDEHLLTRVRDTAQQALLPVQERRANVAEAFTASRDAKGRSVLLVDDICTTASTLCACANALRHAGCNKVYAACICIAGHDHLSM